MSEPATQQEEQEDIYGGRIFHGDEKKAFERRDKERAARGIRVANTKIKAEIKAAMGLVLGHCCSIVAEYCAYPLIGRAGRPTRGRPSGYRSTEVSLELMSLLPDLADFWHHLVEHVITPKHSEYERLVTVNDAIRKIRAGDEADAQHITGVLRKADAQWVDGAATQEALSLLLDLLLARAIPSDVAQRNPVAFQTENFVLCTVCKTSRVLSFPLSNLTVNAEMKSLARGLDAFFASETLEGDNAYKCFKCKQKVTAIKGTRMRSLPELLVIPLRRWCFDYDTMRVRKIKSRFEFPLLLDLSKYMYVKPADVDITTTTNAGDQKDSAKTETLQKQTDSKQRQQAPTTAEFEAKSTTIATAVADNSNSAMYTLCAVVIRRHRVDSYAVAREDTTSGAAQDYKQPWIKISPSHKENELFETEWLDPSAFGWRFDDDTTPVQQQKSPQFYDEMYSVATVLVYRKLKS